MCLEKSSRYVKHDYENVNFDEGRTCIQLNSRLNKILIAAPCLAFTAVTKLPIYNQRPPQALIFLK